MMRRIELLTHAMIKLLEPIQWVTRQAEYVHIDKRALSAFARDFTLSEVPTFQQACPFTLHPFASAEEAIDFWFIADMQAFCFWGYPEKWTTTYQKMQLDGWWGLMACLNRGLEAGVPILDGAYLATLSLEEGKALFAGEPEIPLFSERLALLRETGQILKERYHGRFHHFLQMAPTNALKLTIQIAREFPGFEDVALYMGKTVSFYKKAQLLVGDLAQIGAGGPAISGFDELYGEADYKIPALLRSFGILTYTAKLAKMVDARQELPAGSVMEVEIRASMLWAVQLLLEQLHERFPTLNATRLTRCLWVMSQDKTLIKQPYHLTKTVNY